MQAPGGAAESDGTALSQAESETAYTDSSPEESRELFVSEFPETQERLASESDRVEGEVIDYQSDTTAAVARDGEPAEDWDPREVLSGPPAADGTVEGPQAASRRFA